MGKITATRRNFEGIADEDESLSFFFFFFFLFLFFFFFFFSRTRNTKQTEKDNTWITPALANTASFTKNQIKVLPFSPPSKDPSFSLSFSSLSHFRASLTCYW